MVTQFGREVPHEGLFMTSGEQIYTSKLSQCNTILILLKGNNLCYDEAKLSKKQSLYERDGSNMEYMKRPRRGPEYKMPRSWTPHIHLLGTQEFPYYLIHGNEAAAIVEGGLSALAGKVLEDLKTIPDLPPLRYLVAAHAHTDHVTGLLKLKLLLPDLKLVGTVDSAAILNKEKILAGFIEEDLTYAEFLRREGIISELPDRIPPVTPHFDLLVGDKDCLDLGDLTLQFVSAPGHAPGNLCVQILPDNALLISDTAGYGETSDDVYPLFFHHYQSYLDSLDKLAALASEHLGLGHNLTIDGQEAVHCFLAVARKSAEEFRKDVLNRCGKGEAEDSIIRDYAERLATYGLFGHFTDAALQNFVSFLVRRVQE
jgi:2-aminobenzoylacetyl-CoA thioesterase